MSWDMARAGPGSARDTVRQTKEQRKLTMLREIDPLFREPRPTKIINLFSTAASPRK